MIRKYCEEFRKLSFTEKHEAVTTVFTFLLAVAEVLLAVVVFRVTVNLQAQANFLQREQFRSEENERDANRIQDSVAAFALESTMAATTTHSDCENRPMRTQRP